MKNSELLSTIKHLNIPPFTISELENVQNKLNIKFSEEFLEIAKVGSFLYYNNFDINNFLLENERSVIGETLEMRKCGLPNNVLVLFEESESIMLMKCLGTHEEIYWLAIEDFERFCNGEKLEYEYDFFPSFAEFFKFLLKETERREEESAAASKYS